MCFLFICDSLKNGETITFRLNVTIFSFEIDKNNDLDNSIVCHNIKHYSNLNKIIINNDYNNYNNNIRNGNNNSYICKLMVFNIQII